MDLIELLMDVTVWPIETASDMQDGIERNINGWFEVSTPRGVIAYFVNESDAFSFRLDYINRQLNPYEG